ncbi:MAG: hypothetical protein JWR35_413 [Marmoricola sp.]|jgi:DUF4097 and DUF4098 domain-containing protein YvlB|nr:hypothetical protein [Marmoricola sp.]
MNRTFNTPEAVELYVELGSGQIATDAIETDQTTVAITGPRADEFAVEQNGDQIKVTPPKSRVGFLHGNDSHEVKVSLPTGSGLTAKAGSADTVATGSYGVIRLKTGSGDVEIEEAEGPVVIDSGSGDVRGHQIRGEVRIKSGSGDIDLGEVHGPAGISTGSGDVLIGRAHASTVVKTGSGDLEVKRAENDVTFAAGSGDLVVGNARKGSITAKSASGDVRVGICVGTPVWTDITSVTGRVTSQLQSTGKPAEGQDYVEVRATTVSGDIYLEQI